MVELNEKTKMKKPKKDVEESSNVVRRRPRTRSMSEVDDIKEEKVVIISCKLIK